MDILGEICAHARTRVEARKKILPEEELKRQALAQKAGDYAFENALKGENLSLICEIKKASPSKGVIDQKFDYTAIARDYQAGGADCVSCLTEPKWFLGSDEIFSAVRKELRVPLLRKDFTVSEYQIYESKLLGADAVLLILSVLGEAEAKRYFEIAETLGLSVLFECRTREQIEISQRVGGRIVGVNNRNLRDFSVDMQKAGALRASVDRDRLFVSESGVTSLRDLRAVKSLGADACLVGEFCMRAADRRALIGEMKHV